MNLISEKSTNEEYVVGIGAANLDIYGKSLIDLKPKYDHPSKITTSVGGVTRNVLCNLSLLKINTKLLATIGEDIFGKIILEDCIKNNIDINNVLKIKNESTGVFMQIFDNKNDMHMALCDMTINKNITVEYLTLNDNLLKNAKIICFDPSLPVDSIKYLIDNYGSKIYLDPLSDEYALKIKPYIEKTNLAKMFNEEFNDKSIVEKLINFCCIEMQYKKYKEGEVIFKIGEAPSEFYSIIFGKVNLIKTLEEYL
jgi:pseudouridine kinase